MANDLKAIIFDLYGTLIYHKDTNPYLKLFLELGLSAEEIRQARKIVLTEDFDDLPGLVKRIKPDASISLQSYEEEVANGVESANTFPETKEVLKILRERGLKLGLISNLASPYKKPFFDLGLAQYFDSILFSCEVGLLKPDLRIYQKILQEMGLLAFQALMVGDKANRDVDPPQSLGMNAVLIDRNNQSQVSMKIQSLDEVLRYL